MVTSNNQTGGLSPRSSLQQRYTIVKQVGRGGMGAVYEAIDTRLAQRHVAIKELSQAGLTAQGLAVSKARFQQEAHMLSSLSHPNLPHIHDAFSENNRSYLVMDFINGQTLFQMLNELNGKPLSVSQTIMYARQLCQVLNYLHEHNPPIIFRDVKPTNIMLTPNDHLYLIDFGIARFFKEGQTQDTILLGSPGYAAPEQYGSAQTNTRTDMYSLGATLHFCLTGRDPYYAQPAFSFAPVQQYNPGVPLELDQLIQRMLATKEQDRPTSIAEIQKTLAVISQHAEDHTSALKPAPTLLSTMAPTQYIVPEPTITPLTQTAPAQPLPNQATHSPATRQTPPRSGTLPGVWRPGFTALFCLLLATSIIASGYTMWIFHPFYGWSIIVESVLSLLLSLVAGIGTTLTQRPFFKVPLLATTFIALITSITLVFTGWQDAQNWLQSFPPGMLMLHNLNLLFSTGLIIMTLLSLAWTTRAFAGLSRLILPGFFGLALLCTLIQMPGTITDITKHAFLLLALIALVQGLLLAVQSQRVTTQSQSTSVHTPAALPVQ